MIQHLLNTTAIWLLCLLVYDLFLRKETFHKYNRIYLLSSLVLGLVLPAISWQKDTMVYHTPLDRPLQELVTVKQSIETTIVPAGDTFNIALIVLFVYLTGIFFSLVLIGKDVLLLIRLYRKGSHRKEARWTVITTNEAHGPFSIFNYLFVGNRKLYDDREWQMLLQHEQQHASHLHFIDLLLMQLTRVFFWFHPLVYVFQQRLLLIHEYQADMVGVDEPAEYGTFLVEQALLQANPAITHSFNRSPIKKRIIMLTKKSSKRNLLKALVALPLALCCMFCFTKSAYSYKKGDDNVVVFKGNRFEFSGPTGKPVTLQRNELAGKEGTIEFDGDVKHEGEVLKVSFFASPVKMNGEVIHSAGEVSKEPVFSGKDKDLSNYLFNSAKRELDKLEDGEYFIHISYPIVDKKGNLVYYENKGLQTSNINTVVDKSIKLAIDNKLTEALDNTPKFKPAELDGKPVIWYDAWGIELGYRIIVKDHNAKLQFQKPH